MGPQVGGGAPGGDGGRQGEQHQGTQGEGEEGDTIIDPVEFAIVAKQEGFTPEQVKDLWAEGNIERTLNAAAEAGVTHETLIVTLREELQIETLAWAWSLGKPKRLEKSRQFVRVAIRDRGLRCRYCRLDLYEYDTYNVLDHVTPLSKGGSRGDDNVVIACRDCNGLKGTYPPVGVTAAERIADAERKVRERRAARINVGLRGLLERLIEGRRGTA